MLKKTVYYILIIIFISLFLHLTIHKARNPEIYILGEKEINFNHNSPPELVCSFPDNQNADIILTQGSKKCAVYNLPSTKENLFLKKSNPLIYFLLLNQWAYLIPCFLVIIIHYKLIYSIFYNLYIKLKQ